MSATTKQTHQRDDGAIHIDDYERRARALRASAMRRWAALAVDGLRSAANPGSRDLRAGKICAE